MDNSDNKVELTLIRKDETNAKELQELENNRKKMHEEIMTRNYNEDYYTLKANGLVPYGVITVWFILTIVHINLSDYFPLSG